MSDVIIFMKIIATIYMFCWVIYLLNRLIKGKCDSVIFVMLIYFIFFGVPLLLDIIIGVPNYNFYGFYISKYDTLTNIIYLIYFIIVPIIFWIFGRNKASYDINVKNIIIYLRNVKLRKWIYLILIFIMFSPLVTILFSPNPQIYLDYGFMVKDDFLDPMILEYHRIVGKLTTLSIISCLLILLFRKKNIFGGLFLCLLVGFFDSYLNGKRGIVALFCLGISLVLYLKGKINRRNIILYIVVLLTAFFLFNNFYQIYVRSKNYLLDFEQAYTEFRIDYGRDHELKMAIYSLLYPQQMKILEYKGQSMLFNLLFFIPRDIWPNKPWPYAVYFTGAMLGIKDIHYLGWGMTTSWLGECISNFGWFGFIIGPLSIAVCCRLSDRNNNLLLRLLTILTFSMLLVLQFAAINTIFLLWLLYFIYVQRKTLKQLFKGIKNNVINKYYNSGF